MKCTNTGGMGCHHIVEALARPQTRRLVLSAVANHFAGMEVLQAWRYETCQEMKSGLDDQREVQACHHQRGHSAATAGCARAPEVQTQAAKLCGRLPAGSCLMHVELSFQKLPQSHALC